MEAALKYLDDQSWVEKYAWFALAVLNFRTVDVDDLIEYEYSAHSWWSTIQYALPWISVQ